MRWLPLALALALALACKEKQQAPSPATKPAPAPAPSEQPSAPAQTPSSPTASEAGSARPNKPITIEEATAALPKLDGREVIGLKQTSDQGQVHGTWCIDGTSADDVAKHVGHALAQAKYTNLTIRGDARKAGVAGDRDGIRLSMVVSASSAAVCAAPAHYFASATIFKL
jgi:hypothetical protein